MQSLSAGCTTGAGGQRPFQIKMRHKSYLNAVAAAEGEGPSLAEQHGGALELAALHAALHHTAKPDLAGEGGKLSFLERIPT